MMTNGRVFRWLAVPVMIGSLGIAGCASTSDPTQPPVAGGPDAPPSGGGFFSTLFGEDEAELTPAERQLREEATLFNQTVLGGILFNSAKGAALGALTGFLVTGGKLEGLIKGAAVGGGVGAVAGAIDGYRTAKRQEAARQQVREIELMVAEVEGENQRIEQSIRTTDMVIAETRANLQSAQDQLRRKEISAAEYERQRQRAQRNVAAMDELIDGVEQRRDEFSSVAQDMRKEGEDTRALDAEIAQSSARLAELKAERDLLAQDLEVGRIG